MSKTVEWTGKKNVEVVMSKRTPLSAEFAEFLNNEVVRVIGVGIIVTGLIVLFRILCS